MVLMAASVHLPNVWLGEGSGQCTQCSAVHCGSAARRCRSFCAQCLPFSTRSSVLMQPVPGEGTGQMGKQRGGNRGKVAARSRKSGFCS